MPTKTFKNLPQEKQKNLIESAKQEFTRHTMMDSSINKIIQDASIPRGSFYQYFKDKEDLYLYVLEQNKEELTKGINKELNKEDDIFNSFIKIYDFLYSNIITSKNEDYYKNIVITFHKSEKFEKEKMFFFDGTIRNKLKEKINIDDNIKDDLFEILSIILNKTLIDSLKNKENQKEIRKHYINLIEILKNGISKKEEK